MNAIYEQNESGAQPREKNFLERIIGVFTSPTETFKSVGRRPQLAAPLVLVLIISLALSFFITPIGIEESRIEIESKLREKKLTDQQISNIIENQQKFSPFIRTFGTALYIFTISGILLFISNIVLGGNLKYSIMVSIYTYSMFIILLGSLIKLPLIIKQQSVNIFFSLSTFLNTNNSETFMYALLNKFAFFEIWQLITIIIGIATINKFKIKKVAVPIIILWLLFAFATAFIEFKFVK